MLASRLAVLTAVVALLARPAVGVGAPLDRSLSWLLTIDHARATPVGGHGRARVELGVTVTERDGSLVDPAAIEGWRPYVDGKPLDVVVARSSWCERGGELAVVVLVTLPWNYDEALVAVRTEVATLLDAVSAGSQPCLVQVAVSRVDAEGHAPITLGSVTAARAIVERLALDRGPAAPRLLPALEDSLAALAVAAPTRRAAALRRAVVIVGDGRSQDLASTEYARLGGAADAAGVRIHTIGYHPDGDRRYLLTLAELSRRSHGTFRWLPEARFNPRRLARLVAALGRELREQPLLTFELSAAIFDRRVLTVRATAAGREIEARNQVVLRAPGTGAGLGWVRYAGLVALVVALALAGWRRVRGRRGATTPSVPTVAPVSPPVPPPPVPRGAAAIGHLEVVDGSSRGRRVAAAAGVRVGRDPSLELVLDDPAVSALHLVLEEREGRLVLVDHSSTGTLVNDVRCAAVALQDGMRIRVGTTTLRFTRESR